jgi:MoxR-like ATPase
VSTRALSHTVDGVTLQLSHPVELPIEWVGREELKLQLLAAWLVLADEDVPLTPRLTGKPGVGKTTLGYAVARSLGREVYLLQATMDTRPEDLIVTPVIGDDSKLRYVASPIVTAMIRGGVCILDEGNRMSEKSWASLAPLLDARRYVESIVAGIRISADRDFRLVATMNQDASTFDLPEYIHSRLQPQILIDFPDADEEKLILKRVLPFSSEQVLDYVVSFLQLAHAADERYTVRDGINIARYALKSCAQAAQRGREREVVAALEESVEMTLGPEARRYLEPALEKPRGPRGPIRPKA